MELYNQGLGPFFSVAPVLPQNIISQLCSPLAWFCYNVFMFYVCNITLILTIYENHCIITALAAIEIYLIPKPELWCRL